MDSIFEVKKIFNDACDAITKFASNESNILSIIKTADAIRESCLNGGKVLVFGNGGSAADSQHLAAELVVRFEKERESIPCIALNTDTSILTAAANDYNFSQVFSRQIEALVKPNDVVIGISTSGNSENVNKAVILAKSKKAIVVAITGRTGGELVSIADIAIVVNEKSTARIQEVHSIIIHAICKLLEEFLTQ